MSSSSIVACPTRVDLGEVLGGQLVAGLDVDLAGLVVDQVERAVAAEDLLGRDQQRLQPVGLRLAGEARGDLGAEREGDFAGLGVDDVEARLRAAPLLGLERHDPAALPANPCHAAIEFVEDFLAVVVQRVQQRRDRQLALAVDTDVDDVLGVEFEVEPAAAIRDDPGGEQELAARVRLAAVVVEEHARRAVHLADDDALGAVDDEGAVARHQRHVAHVDVLLLDIEHGPRLGIGVDLEDDQAQRDAHRRGVGHAALAALVGVVLGVLEFIMDEVELGGAGEVADGEHRPQRLLEAAHVIVGRARAEEMLVRFALHLDQVRHLDDLADRPERLADALPRGEAGAGGDRRNCLGRHNRPFRRTLERTPTPKSACSGRGTAPPASLNLPLPPILDCP